MGGTGLEPVTPSLSIWRMRSGPFACVRSTRTAEPDQAIDRTPERTRTNLEPCHPCHARRLVQSRNVRAFIEGGGRRSRTTEAGTPTARAARRLYARPRDATRLSLAYRSRATCFPHLRKGSRSATLVRRCAIERMSARRASHLVNGSRPSTARCEAQPGRRSARPGLAGEGG
jgi:hypothetical protein